MSEATIDAAAWGERPRVRVERLDGGGVPGVHDVVALAMTAADRRRVRRAIDTPKGLRIELALPTGTVLPVGAVLCVWDGVAYTVAAASEQTIEVRPRSMVEAARVAHLIGNMHRDVDVAEVEGVTMIVALWNEALHRRLERAGFVVRVVKRPFMGRAAGEHAHGGS